MIPMREVIVVANWKMNTTPVEAGPLAVDIARRTRGDGVIRVICPPFVCLPAVHAALVGEDVEVGVQNIHTELAGAYTGEVAAPMVAGSARWVILGHSERRRDAGESDATVARKVARALETGLRPIVCVGEQLEDRDAGRAADVVRSQVGGSLAGVADTDAGAAGIVIAYEPVWAIGTGRTARGTDAAAMADAIRQALEERGWSAAAAARLPVLYGGSVTAATIGEFVAEPALDGALVGGASLKPDEMAGIVGAAGIVARQRLARQRLAAADP
jgi:triosephosphate isomerase